MYLIVIDGCYGNGIYGTEYDFFSSHNDVIKSRKVLMCLEAIFCTASDLALSKGKRCMNSIHFIQVLVFSLIAIEMQVNTNNDTVYIKALLTT